MSDLEKEILEIINTTVKGQYTGGLKVVNDDGFYVLFLYMDSSVYPSIQLGIDCDSEEDFKNYIRDEIKARRLESVSYSRLIQELPSIVCDE